MDNETITANSIGWTYMINGSTFAKRYKDTLSDYSTWDQKEHAAEYILIPQNLGKDIGIDETSVHNELYTIVHNKEGHGRQGSIIAVIKGINPTDVSDVLNMLPEENRMQVESITMDLSDSMRAITKVSFPNTMVIRDCFHVIRRGGEACDEIRLRCKRDAVKNQNKDKAEHNKRLKRLTLQRKAYANRMKKKYGKDWKKSNRGRKPQRINSRFVPKRLENGETLAEALTRSSKQLKMSRDNWSASQEARGKILFGLYPKLEEAYNLINSLRSIFRNKTLDKESAKIKLEGWYNKVTACTLREVKSVRDTIRFYQDEILNYFIAWQTNASAESLNSKIKCFRTQVKGVSDIPFFMYRIATVLG